MFRRGQIPNAIQLESGSILVEISEKTPREEKVVVYARVSSPKQREDLHSQATRIENFCIANGWSITKTYKEIASGLNDTRPILMKMLKDRPTKIVIEHKDRLTRFGFEYIKELCNTFDCDIIIINNNDNSQDDLMTDFVSIITSMTAKLYGLRKSHRKTEKIIQELNKDD